MSPLQRRDFHARSSRQAILSEEFGFKCECTVCLEEDFAENDRMRERILQIEEMWSKLGSNPSSALALAEEQFDCCLQIGLQSGLMSYVALHGVEAAGLALSSSNEEGRDCRKLARKFSSAASSHALIAYGEASQEMDIFHEISSVCESVADGQLLARVQTLIATLRDIET